MEDILPHTSVAFIPCYSVLHLPYPWAILLHNTCFSVGKLFLHVSLLGLLPLCACFEAAMPLLLLSLVLWER